MKDIFTEDSLRKLEVNERQIRAILHVKEKGQITNSDHQKINEIGKSVAATELKNLVDKRLLIRTGSTGRSTLRSNLPGIALTDEVFIMGFGICQALFYVITSEVDMPQKTYTTYTITTSFFL